MRAAAAVVFLTAIPLAALLIVVGTADGRPSEVIAGLLLALLIGIPTMVAGYRARDRDPG